MPTEYKLTGIPDHLPAGNYTTTLTSVSVGPDCKITIKAKFDEEAMEQSWAARLVARRKACPVRAKLDEARR